MLQIETKEQFIARLKENIDQNIVIHYKCAFCADEQVTYKEEASDVLETFEKYGYLVLGYDCTNCGSTIQMLHVEEIFGIEVV